MADDTTPDPGTTATDLLPEPTPSATPRRRRVLALWGVLAVLAVGAGAVVVRSRDDNPPRLPIALGAAAGESTRSAAGSSAPVGPGTDMAMLRPVTYVAGDDLPLLGGSGAAYRLRGGITEDQVRTLGKAFGLTGTPTQDGTHWSVQGESGRLDVEDGGGGMWWYSSGEAMAGAGSSGSGSVSSSGGGTASPPGAVLDAPVASDAPVPAPDAGATTTVVGASSPAQAIALCPPDAKCAEPAPFVPPADLPTEAEARAKALALLRSVGADVDHADVHVDGPYEAWYITVEPRVDGLVASGLSYSVQIGPKGAISGAGGTLARPERLGDYPVLDTRKAIDRLNTQYAVPMGAPEDLAARDSAATATAPPDTIEPNTVSPDTGCDKVAPPPDGGTDVTTMEACATPTEPYVPPEPQTIVLHGAERILMLVPASDGSTDAYLVPGYRFTGDEETVLDQIAVDDDSLVPQQARVPADDPTRVYPTDPNEVRPLPTQVDPAVGETKPAQ